MERNMGRYEAARRRQAGYSMIELLMVMLVISVIRTACPSRLRRNEAAAIVPLPGWRVSDGALWLPA